ncbi:hypothetical protein ScalyP_jg2861, partial [Parmales sp. scaly parma]
MIHKALLGLSAHRDGLAEGRMTGLLRVALCENLPDSKSLRPLMASAAQKISSRLIYALKQCWRFEKVIQSATTGHGGGDREGEIARLRADQQMVWEGNMSSSPSMIILFA